MNASEQQDEVELLLKEAEYRLRGAITNAPRDGDDARIACENAHDAIEVSLNAVIVARGEKYRASHDLSQLADIAGRAGEAIPAELIRIRSLRPYTGGGRYSYRRAGQIEPATKSDYDQIVDLAKRTYAWATGRARELCGLTATRETVQISSTPKSDRDAWKSKVKEKYGIGDVPKPPPPAPESASTALRKAREQQDKELNNPQR